MRVAVSDFRARQEPAVVGSVGPGGINVTVRRCLVGTLRYRRRNFRTQRSPAFQTEFARFGLFGGVGRACDHKWDFLTAAARNVSCGQSDLKSHTFVFKLLKSVRILTRPRNLRLLTS